MGFTSLFRPRSFQRLQPQEASIPWRRLAFRALLARLFVPQVLVVDVIKLFWRKSIFPQNKEIEKVCFDTEHALKYENNFFFQSKLYSKTIDCF